MNISKKTPTEKNKIMLDTLQQAVAEALEKKRKLGQYAVIWDENKPIAKGDDAPDYTR